MHPIPSYLIGLFLLVSSIHEISAVDALKKYKISDVTVSGISSGAYMAVQMHIAFSSVVNGSAIFAGGPFYCAEGNLAYAEGKCMNINLGLPQVEGLVLLTNNDALYGFIDPTYHLKDDKVYLFSGQYDSVVNPKVMQSLQAYYESFVSASNIVADYHVEAEHCFPTLSYGNDCKQLAEPYISKCSFDGAENALKALYGSNSLQPAVKSIPANLLQFNQKEYYFDSLASLADTGYIYVPTSCQNNQKTCHLHISFHGCLQSQDFIQNSYAVNTGFNEWAESNNIIVLYPFAKKSSAVPLNPNGCWDWWGYTNPIYYGVKNGVQMEFVRKLIKAVSGL